MRSAAWEPAFSDGWHGWWHILGGLAAPSGPVSAVSRSADKLDIFVVGTDSTIYTAACEPAFADGWHGWWNLIGGGQPTGRSSLAPLAARTSSTSSRSASSGRTAALSRTLMFPRVLALGLAIASWSGLESAVRADRGGQ